MFPWEEGDISTPQGRRNYIRFNIDRYKWENFPGIRILEGLREVGLGISPSDFYSIRRDVLAGFEREEVFTDISSEGLLPISRFREDHGASLSMALQYRYTITATDMETGEQIELNRSLSGDVHYTHGEAIENCAGYFTTLLEKYKLRIDEITLDDIWKNPDRRPRR